MRKKAFTATAALAGVALMGFTVEEAGQALNGEWQGTVNPVAMSYNSSNSTATYVDGGTKIAGSLTIQSVVAKSITFSIGSKNFVAHILEDGSLQLAEAGRRGTITMKRVR
ncbi:hypothetical protein [Microvirga zambiensis]|uniref:hypothetical protein n=1 Tax=Microvirga zambiensis TaxID=1402137 RepID=UPI00191FEED9|nr:hypothetical protein [Microvirga zambiensis]